MQPSFSVVSWFFMPQLANSFTISLTMKLSILFLTSIKNERSLTIYACVCLHSNQSHLEFCIIQDLGCLLLPWCSMCFLLIVRRFCRVSCDTLRRNIHLFCLLRFSCLSTDPDQALYFWPAGRILMNLMGL
jgi:hypothetical protein